MIKSILDLPDDVLIEIFTRCASIQDLCRLLQVCRRFYDILDFYESPWKSMKTKLFIVSYSKLKNATGCPLLKNIGYSRTIVSDSNVFPADYQYKILFDNSINFPQIIPENYRPSLDTCSKADCDMKRLINNYRYSAFLSLNWNSESKCINNKLINFVRRPQTSYLQYDEHNHQLWFTHHKSLHCLNIDTNNIDYAYETDYDDILCYKVYNDDVICLANGRQLKILCRQTNDIYFEDDHYQQDDILSLDVYSNDDNRYTLLNGTRDYLVSIRTFNMSTLSYEPIWHTQMDDRVLCTRFTPDGKHFLIGTGGTKSLYPLILFDTERPQPIYAYKANYRLGAGVRCIEWATPNVFIAAGFDSQFKEFDIRTGICHYTYSDPFANNYASMAVSSDKNGEANGIVLGCDHHSTVRLVNRKQRQVEKVFFVSKNASPVHSLAVTPEYLFASVDLSIVALDFTRSNNRLQQICRRI